jgi:hypothetical protein
MGLSEHLAAIRESLSFGKLVMEVRQTQTISSLAISPRLGRVFTFTVKSTTLECDVSEVVSASAAVLVQFSVDACACTCSLSDVDCAISAERSLSTLWRRFCNQIVRLQCVWSDNDLFALNWIRVSSLSLDATTTFGMKRHLMSRVMTNFCCEFCVLVQNIINF